MSENQVKLDKMAVSAIDPASISRQNEFQRNESDVDKKSTIEPNPKKKSCFQITRVITKSGGSDLDQADGDIDDDLDETNTEEVSSVSFDVSKTNEGDFEHSEDNLFANSIPPGVDEFVRDLNSGNGSSTPQTINAYHDGSTLISNPILDSNGIQTNPVGDICIVADTMAVSVEQPHVPQLILSKDKPSESRFKVVKIESHKPFQRGRWSCQDFLDPPSTEKGDKEKPIEEVGSHGSGNSSNSSSVHFVPGVDEPLRNAMTDCQNGDYGSQSQPVFSNGSHIGKNPTMPSQNNAVQVPNSMTQTHMQNVLPPSDLGSQYAPSSNRQQGATINGQPAQNTILFSQASMPPNSSAQAVVQQNQVQSENGQEYIPPQSEYIPNTTRHPNAQETALSQQLQSSSSQEFSDKVQQNFRTQTVDVRSSNPSDTTKGDYTELAYTTTGNGDKQAELSEQDSVNRDLTLKATGPPHSLLAPPLFEISSRMSHIDKDDESGASTVAIDNKIEQAMDLVKTHLMYAVREEVDVLREQIKELLEKNSQLEYENQLLKQTANAETLSQIQQPRPPRGQNQPSTSKS